MALAPRMSLVGDCALLFHPATEGFDARLQTRLLTLAQELSGSGTPTGFRDVVLGVNNILIAFDPFLVTAASIQAQIELLWGQSGNERVDGRALEIPVVYGGTRGEDLPLLAANAGLSVERYIESHSQASYQVACIGAYPGFAYLSGLPPALTAPRRATPRLKLAKGSVIVGGVQAGVMPCTAPSGWHVIGTTSLEMFDLGSASPCLLLPGDRVRFRIEGIES